MKPLAPSYQIFQILLSFSQHGPKWGSPSVISLIFRPTWNEQLQGNINTALKCLTWEEICSRRHHYRSRFQVWENWIVIKHFILEANVTVWVSLRGTNRSAGQHFHLPRVANKQKLEVTSWQLDCNSETRDKIFYLNIKRTWKRLED